MRALGSLLISLRNSVRALDRRTIIVSRPDYHAIESLTISVEDVVLALASLTISVSQPDYRALESLKIRVRDLVQAYESLPISVSQPDYRAAAPARPYTYEDVFESIVNFIIALRHNEPLGINEPLGLNEYDVTRNLAGPFTQGGLLVLLQEPRVNHTWDYGVDWVVSDCASLDILREGLRVVSGGKLSITSDVSVIDRWPFLHKNLQS